jgi:hypothetical protein
VGQQIDCGERMIFKKEEIEQILKDAKTELYRNTAAVSLEYKQAKQVQQLCEDWLEFDTLKNTTSVKVKDTPKLSSIV